MWRFRGTLGMILVLCVILASLVGCADRYRLPVLDADNVPQDVRDDVPPNRKDIVWRAFESSDQHLFLAYTYTLEYEGRKEQLFNVEACWYDPSSSSVAHSLLAIGGTGDPARSFSSYETGGTGYDYEREAIYSSLGAYGTAFDSAVTKVVGTTSAGTRVEGVVRGGFWVMGIEPAQPDEQWETLTAVRLDGSVRHKYQITKN